MNKKIRVASIGDIYEISKLFASSWRFAYKDIVNHLYLQSISDEHWVKFLYTGISEQSIDCLVVEDDNRIVVASVIRESLIEQFPNDMEIVGLYLLPESIGNGYGHELLISIADLCSKKGYAHCVLDVLADNRLAKRFYKRNGFVQTEFIVKTTLGSQELECNIMRKELP